ncbi:putative LRR receptor-like serine/threonine-protein kinase [Raphanus sativus]|uniref:non-specific serine/threonine protein kinase n=1 Tax=Raphanus sativus TaxID=3726 RepID=A0A6J0K0W2_RAPSA|nr:probable LRR receptor-like serine/threonine-protein kinase At3g47570 [Raphanus sativus]KAJ4890411.1 putative LRR receptor-like serine/threonine-protein kinase [Raphanus sativus]
MRLFILLSFNAFILLEAYGFTDETDRQALLEFKSQVSQDKRVFLSSWNHSNPLCNWNKVTCGHKHKRVTQLDLGGLQLGGVISPSIGNLSFLISLDLSSNSFGGTIPQEVGNLFRLEYLNMSFNILKGDIPVSLFNCSRLFDLELDSNQLGGGVPSELGSLTNLLYLYLGRNNLKGKLPASLGNLTSLMQLSFTDNKKLEGEIPNELARLNQMVFLSLSMNNFSGMFPPSIYNLSSLEMLNIFSAGFSGRLKPDLGTLLPNLQELYMGNNHFTGVIPATLSNISTLEILALEYNNLTGSIPSSFGKLQNLEILLLHGNSLGNHSFGDLDFIDALSNCTQLLIFSVGFNRLGGDLPTSIANLSTSLIELKLQMNDISGSIPHDIGNLINLSKLEFDGNMLRGTLPNSLGMLLELGYLSLDSNRLSGVIPSSIGNMTQLETLYLNNNSFEGPIPPSLGNCRRLLYLYIGCNRLNGTIPREIMQISSLVHIFIEDTPLTGSLPNDVGRLQSLVVLSLANASLSGQLPQTLGKCLSMEELYLQENSFVGAIPDIRGLVGVRRVDLSKNNLSGSIPEYLAKFPKLEYLNLSVNNLQGKVPTEGNFQNSTIVLVYGNKNLCGDIKGLKLDPCIAQASSVMKKHSSLSRKVVIGVCLGISLVLIFLLSLCWFIKRKKKKQQQTSNTNFSTLEVFHEKISYGDLRNATNGFSSSNCIGSGSFGTVFKALLPAEKDVVAVKVLNLKRRGAMKSFMAECESLKDIRHRNLVKLLTACSSIDYQGNEFRALIYEFMPNGSLEMWLHPEEVEEIHRPSRALTLLERLDIAIDVASVLEYLHVHCPEPIAHCDLKPSNILLDNDLTAHVSDFGLARILLKYDQESFLNYLSSGGVRGTIGYSAPEYGLGGQPSVHGDVYSFGVLLLETFTGKRPTNELFGGNFTLRSYTKSALPERVLDIADKLILHSGLRVGFPHAECLALVLEVGLRCCEESPTNRLGISQVVKDLISVKERFFRARS